MKRNVYIIFTYFFAYCMSLWGQPGSIQSNMLWDTPVANKMYPADLETEFRMYPNGGLLLSMLVGITDHFSLGVSYGGEEIIGTGKANMNPIPCVHVRFLLLEELFLSPALLIGFNSQGYGGYIKDLKRYAVKSHGVYAVVSKNTSFLGGIGLHGGINWSLENQDGDSDPNFFAGCHKHFGSELTIIGEYDTAINDNSDDAVGSGKGYLNCGIRWYLSSYFSLEFAWKNVLENGKNVAGSSREAKLVFFTSL